MAQHIGDLNVRNVTTPELDIWPPATITDLVVTDTRVRTVSLQWTTPADQGQKGLAGYDLRLQHKPHRRRQLGRATAGDGRTSPRRDEYARDLHRRRVAYGHAILLRDQGI